MKTFLEIQSDGDEKFLFHDLEQAKETLRDWMKSLNKNQVNEFLDVIDKLTHNEIRGPYRSEVLALFDSISMRLTRGGPRITEEEYDERTVVSGQGALIQGRERSTRRGKASTQESSNIIHIGGRFLDI